MQNRKEVKYYNNEEIWISVAITSYSIAFFILSADYKTYLLLANEYQFLTNTAH